MPDHVLGLTSQTNEIAVDSLSVRGTIPPWLDGTLVRNGPAKFEVGPQSYRHWFDGLAMLHAFTFRGGQVSYRNRFLRSRAYNAAVESGRIRYSEFATDPCRSLFGRLFAMFRRSTTDNANVNVTRLADRFVAMTETPLRVEFDPRTLETAGVVDYADRVKAHTASAHPHVDEAGRLVSYLVRFSRTSEYLIYHVAPGSTRREVVARTPVREPGYLHSFAITDRYAVLVDFPLRVNPLRMIFSGRPFIDNYRWRPDQPTRFYVWDRHTGEQKGIFESDAVFAFHHINAFEAGDRLHVDIAAYDDATLVDAIFLDRLRTASAPIPDARFRRYTLPLAGGPVTQEILSDQPIELPRIHYAQHNRRPYRYAWGVSRSPEGLFFDQLVKVDVHQRTTQVWREPNTYPGEPVFIPTPNPRSDPASGPRAEDDGLLLSVVLSPETRNSFLLILDAATFTEVARAQVPQHIPFGFHGQFVAAQ